MAFRVGGAEADSWSDIAVAGMDDRARRLCERLVDREVRTSLPALQPQVVRPCVAEPLEPALPRSEACSPLLLDQTWIGHGSAKAPAITLSSEAPDGRTGPPGATLTHISRLASVEECTRLRSQTIGTRERENRQILRDELSQVEQAMSRDCASASSLREQCKFLDGGLRDGANHLLLERNKCWMKAAQADSDCRSAGTMRGVIVQRLAQSLTPAVAGTVTCTVAEPRLADGSAGARPQDR